LPVFTIVRPIYAAARERFDHQYRVLLWRSRTPIHGCLQSQQGQRRRYNEDSGGRMGRPHTGQCDRTRFRSAIPGHADGPLCRIAEPSALIGAVVFLSSSVSSYVTGAVLIADGEWNCATTGPSLRQSSESNTLRGVGSVGTNNQRRERWKRLSCH